MRLYQVQIVEHEVWADQAANLVRSGQIVPFERGRLLDRQGRTLVRDQKLYRVDFVYRDFRRGHALGLVTHARSTLEMRAVSLEDGAQNLVAWAFELVDLSPAGLAAWAEGGALETATLSLPAQPRRRARPEHRYSRARDLGFYATRLLGLSRSEGRELRRVLTEGEQRASFFELVARWRGLDEPGRQRLRAELERGWRAALDDLDGLARLLDSGSAAVRAIAPGGPGRAGFDARGALIADLETCRRRVEDGTASRLFREAAGFGAGRVEAEVLASTVDLDWIALRLRWDRERLLSWLRDARAQWLGWRDTWVVDAVAAELALESDPARWPEIVLAQTLAIYSVADDAEGSEPDDRHWADAHELLVVDQLADAFESPRSRSERGDSAAGVRAAAPLLPTDDEQVRAFVDDGALLLAHCMRWGHPDAGSLSERQARVDEARRWRDTLTLRRLRSAEFAEHLREFFAVFERHFAAAVEHDLAACCEAAGREDLLGPDGRLNFREERLDRATERAVYIRRDLGSREQRIAADPDYEVVHMLSRYPDRYAGFEVHDTHVRVHEVFGEQGVPLAKHLVGHVRQSDVLELREQRQDAQELASLLVLGKRTSSEDERIEALLPRVVRPEEVRGAEGLEALLDPELRGHNGYQERRGLSDRADRQSRRWSVEPVDGTDVTLTLDLDLQRAAEACLAHPADDIGGAGDAVWRSRPVGALVLISVDGEVLAAASAPTVSTPTEELSPELRARPPQWAQAIERTLGKPGFQPPGSVFKPFVAAWAIEALGWDPALENDCSFSPEVGAAGYKDLRCWRSWGHGPVDLHGAILGSCNAYFARMGEALSVADLAAVCREFGFGLPTGIDQLPAPRGGAERRQSVREIAIPLMLDPERPLSERELRMAGNGLGVIEATPMQVARATAGLATGRLPQLRLVRAIDGRPIVPRGRDIAISRPALDYIRAAMYGVASEQGGTAMKAELTRERLGFSVAAKTGSGDYAQAPLLESGERGPSRKHTWFAGWFPAEEPRYVLIVFCHDIMVTASHSTIWIARDFLDRPEVRAYLEREGVIE